MNNAGFVLGVDRVGSINPDDVESMFATNVLGLIDMTQLFVNRMLFLGIFLAIRHRQTINSRF